MPRSFLVKKNNTKEKAEGILDEASAGVGDVISGETESRDVMKEQTCLTHPLDSPTSSGPEDESDVEIDVMDTEDVEQDAMETPPRGVAPQSLLELRCQTSPDIGDEPQNPKEVSPIMTSLQERDDDERMSDIQFSPWQFHVTAARAHPYLALSFQRLQQLHLQAMQDRLKFGHLHPFPVSPFHMRLPLPTPTQSLPFMNRSQENPLYLSPTQLMQVDTARMRSKWDSEATKPPFSPETPLNLAKKLSTEGLHPALTPQLPWNPHMMTSFGMTDSCTAARQRREEPPRYQCDACGKSYATFSGLSKHKQFHCSTHVKKQFSCKYCEKTYVSLGALKMHIRTHTLPCKCPLCGKAFSRPWLLQGHIRTHTGEKPFRCQHCARAFADRSNLRAHLQTHTDIKKYNCKSCSKTFSRMSLLLKHEEGGGCPGLPE